MDSYDDDITFRYDFVFSLKKIIKYRKVLYMYERIKTIYY